MELIEPLSLGKNVVSHVSKPSSRDMVLGTQGVSQLSSDIPELDVEIRDDDVTVSSLDGTPLINFSKRLHSLINANLSNSVVVRLLGRPIGYSTLESIIKLLWKPCGAIVLVNLDNMYYFVCFAMSVD
ncbi:hypothetical protein V6N12_035075 [Hibiscus sabdariffa]|uniref:DUF4283 domain-containing protein n=1 Tax=Hibiscus sabdariffa TaxID=183260 RepID=A0ABR2A7I4_9ROSI